MADAPDERPPAPDAGNGHAASRELARGLALATPDVVPPAGADPFLTRGPGLKRFRARWLALVAAIVIALWVCWLMLEPFVEVLLWATVLAIVFYPFHVRLVRRWHNPGLAAAASCAVVVTVILAPLVLVSFAVVGEAEGFGTYLSENGAKLVNRDATFFQFLRRHNVDVDALISWENVAQRLQTVGGAIAGRTLGLLGWGLMTALTFVFVILTLYYLFRDGERLKAALIDGLPLERAQTLRIFDRTREVIGASVYGVLVIASIQAALGGIAFYAVGLPSPLLWTVVMFFLSMIPMAGSFIVWVPASLFLLSTGHWIKALVLAAWCLGVIGMLDNVLRPRLVGKKTRLHELLVFFSVLGGLKVFGPLGLVVGPVVVAITLALIDIFRKAERPLNVAEPTLAERQAALRNVPRDDDVAPVQLAASTAGDSARAGVYLSSRERRKAKRPRT